VRVRFPPSAPTSTNSVDFEKAALVTRTIRCLLLGGAVVLTTPKIAIGQSSQSASIQAEMLKDWLDLKDTLMKIADEMPAEAYGFKPTPPQETFGRRVVHIGAGANRFLSLLGAKAAAPALDPAQAAMTKAGAMKAMANTFDYGIAILREQTDETMLQTVNVPFLGESSRARVFTFLIGHTWDLYGQLAVYLRLQGHVPPASRRP
jgi:uncharacterized damage-inducible protein DinB